MEIELSAFYGPSKNILITYEWVMRKYSANKETICMIEFMIESSHWKRSLVTFFSLIGLMQQLCKIEKICSRQNLHVYCHSFMDFWFQGCQKLFRAGGANRMKGASRAQEASRCQRERIVQKRHFAMFCYYNSLLILAQLKHKKFGTLWPPLAPLGKGRLGQSPTLAPCAAPLA